MGFFFLELLKGDLSVIDSEEIDKLAIIDNILGSHFNLGLKGHDIVFL